MFLSVLFVVIKIILVCLSVAFITLMERKVLGYVQLRLGPDKVSYMGILQPIADALKLMVKEKLFNSWSISLGYFFMPIFSLYLSFLFWLFSFMKSNYFMYMYAFLFFMMISSMGVYSVLGAGWVSNSKYASLGGLRSVAQTISYEVCYMLILLVVLSMVSKYSMLIESYLYPLLYMVLMLPIFMMWFISCIAETNRSPFDFAEGESEIVSGFNIEFASFEFAILFISEYMNIIFMGFISCILFCLSFSSLFLFFMTMMLCMIILMARGSYPRFRYDQLMELMWKSFLNYSLMWYFMILVFV